MRFILVLFLALFALAANAAYTQVSTVTWVVPTEDTLNQPLVGANALTGGRFICVRWADINTPPSTDIATWTYTYNLTDLTQSSIALNVLMSSTDSTRISCVIQYSNQNQQDGTTQWSAPSDPFIVDRSIDADHPGYWGDPSNPMVPPVIDGNAPPKAVTAFGLE